MTTEQLSTAVYEKMLVEQQDFRKALLGMKAEDILDQAYVYAVREDILCAMENTELSMEQAYALLATETPLAQVYKTYLTKDTDYMEHIADSLEELADNMAKLQEEMRELPVYRHRLIMLLHMVRRSYTENRFMRISPVRNQLKKRSRNITPITVWMHWHRSRLFTHLAMTERIMF